MGLQKPLQYRGIYFPKLYGTLTRNTVNIFKNEDLTFTITYTIKWYVIEVVNTYNCIGYQPLIFNDGSLIVSSVPENLYTTVYDSIKASDPTIIDYLDPIPYVSQLQIV